MREAQRGPADRAPRTDWDFDVAVGGGPGGSSTATALALCGRRVLLLEREQFPRFHIGDSQLALQRVMPIAPRGPRAPGERR